MEQTNIGTADNSNSDRRVDSSRWRADVEAADQQARQRAVQSRQEEDEGQLEPPEVAQAAPLQQSETAQADVATDPLWQRWWEIQSNFVDDPRSSVAEAHALVSGIVDRVVHQLQEQRSQLEQSWSNGKDISTEDLRRGLHSYRDFLGRLLAQSGKPRG
jgi:hypothetical protein